MFVSEVGDLLIDCAESFTVYSVYSSNYPAAMKLLSRPEMKELLQKLMAAPDARGLSLESFLIKPVQRICKYPLLIRVCFIFQESLFNSINLGSGKIYRKGWKYKRY